MSMFNDRIIRENWQNKTGFTLEESLYVDYIALSVNDYSAKTVTGELKSKGDFAPLRLAKSLNGNIIFKAVVAYIRNGDLPKDTINNEKDIDKFLFSQKTNRDFEVQFNGEKIQNINRYFPSKSSEAGTLERIKIKTGKRARITTEKVLLANDLTVPNLINLVDKDLLADKSQEILDRLLVNERAKELQKSNSEIIKKLQEQGFNLIPKNYKISIKGIKAPKGPDEMPEYNYSKHPAVAAMTGKMFGIIAVDVDKPEKVPPTLMNLLKDANTLKITVPSSSRFKVFFKVSTTKLKDAEYLNTAGLEILYNRPANIAGAYDYRRNYEITGELQELPKELEDMLLSIQKSKVKIKTSQNIESDTKVELNLEKTTEFVKSLLDSNNVEFIARQPNSDWEQNTCNTDFLIVYEFTCPYSDEHTTKNNSKATLLINQSGQIILQCHHKSCELSLKELQKEFNKAMAQFLKGQGVLGKKELAAIKACEDYVSDIPASTASENIEIESLIDELEKLQSKELVFVKAPTGCGKTTTLIKHAESLSVAGVKVTILCATRKEVERVIGKLKQDGFGDMITPAIKGRSEITNPKNFGLLVISTYAYLDYKGDTGEIYEMGKHILTGRVVICDEIQTLQPLSEKIIPLCARYHKNNGTLWNIEKCSRITKQGNCKDCYVIKEIRVSKDGNIGFHSTLPTDAYKEDDFEKDEIFKPDFYSDVEIKNLKIRKIEPNTSILKPYPKIAKIVAQLENTDLRILFPILERDGKIKHLTREDVLSLEEKEIKNIKYPVYACGIPTVYGKSNIIIDNLLTYSEKVIATSATVPESVEKTFNERAKFFGFKVKPTFEITTVLMTFDITFFKLDTELSLNDKISILERFNTPTFFVEATRKKASGVYSQIKNKIELAKRTEYFDEGDFKGEGNEKECRKAMFDGDKNIMLTYANSSICKAIDMPDVRFLVVDCSQFLPSIALNLHQNPDIIQIGEQQAKNIEEKLYQIIGRAFRSNLEYRPREQQQDPRKILIILHNLPQELHSFKPFQNLLHNYQEFTDDEVLGLIPSEHLKSLSLNIQAALEGEPIIDKGIEQRKDAIDMAKEIGLKEFSKKYRRKGYDLLTPEDIVEIKQNKKNKKVDENINNKKTSTFKNRQKPSISNSDDCEGENG